MNTPLPQVEPIPHERGRFHVASDRPGTEPYLVDLEEFDGNGFCGCRGFEVRMLPKLVEAQEKRQPMPLLRCKHILRALEFSQSEARP